MRKQFLASIPLSLLALGSIFCSTGNFIPSGISETLESFTEQVPIIQTQVALQLTAASQGTGMPGEDAVSTQLSQQLTEISSQFSDQPGGTDNIPTNTPPEGLAGSIEGNLSYPSEGIPPMAVVAYRVGGQPNEYYYVVTNANQSTYLLENIPEGSYTILAYPMLEGNTLAGGYTQAVPCGLLANCTDHSLIPVPVSAGQDTLGADPIDWYAPQGTFPPNPLP